MVAACPTALAAEPSKATAFLRKLYPQGPWNVWVKEPDTRKNTLLTYTPEEWREMETRLGKANELGWNCYFVINEVADGVQLSTNPGKEQIGRVPFLHVDVDPRPRPEGARDSWFAEEKDRILKSLTTERAVGVPAPTYVTFSGGGFQALWRLAQPIELDGTAEAWDQVEGYTRKLEQVFGGDNCFNVNRLFRLPGFINHPNEKKRKAGRQAAAARENPGGSHEAYTLDQFPPALARALPSKPEQLDGIEPRRLEDSDELTQYGLSPRLLWLVDHGHPGNDPLGWKECGHHSPDDKDPNDRSDWQWDFIRNALRHGVPPELVIGIITDRRWPISAHILDNYPDEARALSKARQQVGKALGLNKEQEEKAAEEFQINEKGIPHKNQHNIRLAMVKLGVSLRYDEFSGRRTLSGLEGHGPDLTDDAVDELWLQMDAKHGLRAGKDFTETVIKNEARRNVFHAVRDYLDRLQWDGRPRLDSWLATYGGAATDHYTRAVGAIVLLAAVRRVRQPGCKFDEMLVLKSPQGKNKSSMLKTLVPDDEWVLEKLKFELDDKEIIEKTRGRWIVECAELAGKRKAKVETVKAFLSTGTEVARGAYGRITARVPRQFILVGTTNSDRFLKDTTGNRRFWPVPVKEFDLVLLSKTFPCDSGRAKPAGWSTKLTWPRLRGWTGSWRLWGQTT